MLAGIPVWLLTEIGGRLQLSRRRPPKPPPALVLTAAMLSRFPAFRRLLGLGEIRTTNHLVRSQMLYPAGASFVVSKTSSRNSCF